MTFGYLLAVKSVSAARKFYEDLFDLTVTEDYGLMVGFDCGLSLQENFSWLTDIPENQMKTKENNCEVYFEITEFDQFIEKLNQRKDITYLHDVKEHSWGQRGIRFYDLDNHLIEVGESLKTVAERFLAQDMTVANVAKRMDIAVSDVTRILESE